MLQNLYIKGLAIIDEIEIEFADGFNVITGETGAGKSILIKALSLLFGEKAPPDLVRHGCDEAQVIGVFNIPEKNTIGEKLKELGIKFDQQIIIRRTVQSKGKSLSWINDVPVTLTIVRDVTSTLMDVFGQHASYGLLNPVYHMRCLDAFLPNQKVKEEYQQAYQLAQAELSHLYNLISEYHRRAAEKDYLTFRFEELSDFNPTVDEYNELLEICKSSEMQLESKESLDEVLAILEQGFNDEPLSKAVWKVARCLDGAKVHEQASATLSDAARLIEDAGFQLRKAYDKIDFSEMDLESAQERLGKYQGLLRRFAIHSIDELMEKLDELRNELEFLETAREKVEDSVRGLNGQCERLAKLSEKLSQAREGAFKKIKSAIEKELHQLAMTGAKLEIESKPLTQTLEAISVETITPNCQQAVGFIAETLSQLSSDGAERIHFLLQSNPGEPARALHKVASGGEMSRIMLALKKTLVAGAQTCVLVFDEIDAGISGEVANIVGQKLKKLAEKFQVVCISHLPQVSAYAEAHFLVAKMQGKRTQSTITKLDEKQSVQELARLLSGDKITPSSLQNAKSLRSRAQQLG